MSPPLPQTGSREQQIAQALIFITPALFCTNMLMARYTADFIPPVALAVWRWLGVFLLLLPFCAGDLWRHRRSLLRDTPKFLTLGVLGMGICGAVVYAVSPVLIIVMARLMFGDRMSGRQMLGTILALAGMLLVVIKGDPATLFSLRFVPGDLMILAAAAAGRSIRCC